MGADVLDEVAERLAARAEPHPLRVGIDGVCGVGKSTFTRALTDRIRARGRPAIHVDSDGFHHVRAIRYRRGRDSARGYYDDAYDFDAVRDRVLLPLGPNGSLRYATKVHDLVTDRTMHEEAVAASDAIVLFDATFLQRGKLRDHWDEVVYLDAPLDVATARGVERDAADLGGREAARTSYATRYAAACRIYLDEERPRDRATIVLDLTDPARPRRVVD